MLMGKQCSSSAKIRPRQIRAALLLLHLFYPVRAFQVCSHTSTIRHEKGLNYQSMRLPTSLHQFSLVDVNLEDLIYQAQTTASSMAKSSLSSHTTPSSLVVLYFAGLLTSFSPCSLGLLPLTISYISSAAGEREDKGTFIPTLAFAAGLAFVFCSLGLSVSLLGGVLGASSGPRSLFLTLLSSVVSISMGLQLLDLLTIPLPSLDLTEFKFTGFDKTAQNAAQGPSSELVFDEEGNLLTQERAEIEASRSSQGGELGAVFRVFLLGGSSALVASPCSTPVLTSILGFLAATRDPALGAILLLTYTIGYSTPLLIVGATGGQALANAQAAASANESSLLGKIGKYVTPLVAGILIFYGSTAILEGLLGDPSMVALDPILE